MAGSSRRPYRARRLAQDTDPSQPSDTPPSSPNPGSSQLPALIAAIGTLLAGIAAAVALFLSPAAPPAQQPAPAKEPSPAPAQMTGFSELATHVIDLVRPLLPVTTTEYSGFAPLHSSYDSIQLSIPSEWTDRQEVSWRDDTGSAIGLALEAGEMVDAIWDDPPQHGVFVGASPETLDANKFLDARRPDREGTCKIGDEGNFLGDRFRGQYRIWFKCGPAQPGPAVLDFAANETQHGGTLALFFRLTDSRDLLALRSALDGLQVSPGLLGDFYPLPALYPAPPLPAL